MDEYTFHPTGTAGNAVVFCATGTDEMLRIAPDGFYVRGAKVPQDPDEAEKVYQAFVSWLSWAHLTKQ